MSGKYQTPYPIMCPNIHEIVKINEDAVNVRSLGNKTL